MDSARRSGRTTRMLSEAVKLAKEGRAVYVVMDNRALCDLYSRGPDAETWRRLGIKFETSESLSLDFGPGVAPRVSRGTHPNCAVLIDHYWFESRFGWVIDGASRWNAEGSSGGALEMPGPGDLAEPEHATLRAA
jgi:hypothetical protein